MFAADPTDYIFTFNLCFLSQKKLILAVSLIIGRNMIL